MALKPRYPDITFLDIVTMKPKCTFNNCIDKFKLSTDSASKRPVSRGRPVNVKPVYVYKCTECGRKVQEAELDTDVTSEELDTVVTGDLLDDATSS